jgi:catechol 2,3-dioxygenase-like lactoylglutathione lyase family enzyme
MPIGGFQHINIRSRDIEGARDFYERIIGLRVGDRPPFSSRGYWLYFGDAPIVHLSQRTDDEAAHRGSGNLDHVAFRGVDFEATRTTLTGAGIAFDEAVVPRDGSRQIFVFDPDGIKLELNFDAPTAAAPPAART